MDVLKSISSYEDVETAIIVVDLIYPRVFHLISPFMVSDIREWRVSFSSMSMAKVSSLWNLKKLSRKTKALTPKGIYISFHVGLNDLKPN